MSITETLVTLQSLQDVDRSIQALEDELQSMPKSLDAAREDQAAVEEQLVAAEAVVAEIEKNRRDLEQEIAEAEGNVVKFETQKLRVKTNTEYQAFNSQIAHEKSRKSELEDGVLLSYDEQEKAADRVSKVRGELDHVRSIVKQKEAELEVRSAEDRRRLEELRGRRDELLPRVDPPLLSRYEAVRAHKAGLAVVGIVRGACGGCFTQQPPQKINEVRKENALHVCEFCGRFFVWDQRAADDR